MKTEDLKFYALLTAAIAGATALFIFAATEITNFINSIIWGMTS